LTCGDDVQKHNDFRASQKDPCLVPRETYGDLVIALLQRVTHARVDVAGECVGAIQCGLLVLLGVERADSIREADRLIERVLGYRVFADPEGKMNLSIQDVAGGLLLVPQFTLAADTAKGMRPSFSSAAIPEEGRRLFDYFVGRVRERHAQVASGIFGADMKITLTNDGPVTFWLHARPEHRIAT